MIADIREGRDLLLLYGGTFDPVHAGHLAIAHAAHAALGVRVHLMPAADPPHRAPPGADARHRARMLELAIAGDRALTVDRRELEREGRSYTVDTLSALRRDVGSERPVALLLGADSFIALPQWKDWRALFELAHFVVAERDGHDLQGLSAELAAQTVPRLTSNPEDLHASPAGRVLRLRQPLADASATRVRAAVRGNDGTLDGLVPPAVAAYIGRHRLYANPGAASAPV